MLGIHGLVRARRRSVRAPKANQDGPASEGQHGVEADGGLLGHGQARAALGDCAATTRVTRCANTVAGSLLLRLHKVTVLSSTNGRRKHRQFPVLRCPTTSMLKLCSAAGQCRIRYVIAAYSCRRAPAATPRHPRTHGPPTVVQSYSRAARLYDMPCGVVRWGASTVHRAMPHGAWSEQTKRK